MSADSAQMNDSSEQGARSAGGANRSRSPLDEIIAELRNLNEPVPQPMSPPTSEEVDAAERELVGGAIQGLHDDYRKFLLEAGDVAYGTLEPCPVAELPDFAAEAWDEMDVPRSLLPICEDNGDYYCMDQQNGGVCFWSHNGLGSGGESWPSLADWIEQVWIGEYQEMLGED